MKTMNKYLVTWNDSEHITKQYQICFGTYNLNYVITQLLNNKFEVTIKQYGKVTANDKLIYGLK